MPVNWLLGEFSEAVWLARAWRYFKSEILLIPTALARMLRELRSTGFQAQDPGSMVRQNNKTKNDDDLFIIERIVDRRRADGKLQYLVKWKDYPS